MGVTDHGIGDVAHEGASHPPKPAEAYHDHYGVDVLGEMDYGLVTLLVHLQVGDRDGASSLFDLPDLLVQDLLGLAPEIFAPHLGIFVVDGCREGASYSDDVEPRIGAPGEVYGHAGGEVGVRRSIGRK